MSSNPTPLAPELDRVYRACQALAANIAEFGAITDPEFIDDVDAALDGLLLPELGQRMENSAVLLNTFSYFHLGPDGEKGVIIERCPSCGRVIKVNQEAMVAIAGEEGHG